MNHTAVADKMVRLAFVSGFFAGLILGVAGCASMVKNATGSPRLNPTGGDAPEVVADQQGAANVATGAITGLNYQSVLPIGMVVMITILTLKDAAILFVVVVLSHRREMLRLKRNGEHP